ncbi:MAG: alkaline phosphatase family protein [Thermoplasmata archaeon]
MSTIGGKADVLPDYEGRSIVNLVSSLAEAMGSESPYRSCDCINEDRLRKKENIVLFILDGISYEYLKKKGKDTVLFKEIGGKLTSVFPSSTASAIPTFYTGLAPQQHAVTGWYTYLRELGTVSTILPFKPRFGDESFERSDVDISSILSPRSIMKSIERKTVEVTPDKIKDSVFNIFYAQNSERIGYSTLEDMFSILERYVILSEEETYIKAYWNGFDSAAHEDGVNSVSASETFLDIAVHMRNFIEVIKDTDTTVIVTSDHGFIDSSRERSVRLQDHPELEDCLTLPLCGDYRSVFCYVRPSKESDFVEYWEDNLKDVCELHESEELIEQNYFGLHEPDPVLPHRVGDYTFIMKDDYIMYDTLANEKEHFIIGHHGGTTKEEMYVPVSKFVMGRD